MPNCLHLAQLWLLYFLTGIVYWCLLLRQPQTNYSVVLWKFWQIYMYSLASGVWWWFACACARVCGWVSLYEVAVRCDRKVVLLLDSYELLHIIDFNDVLFLSAPSRWLWHSVLAVVVNEWKGNLKVAQFDERWNQDEVLEGHIMSLKTWPLIS